MSLISIEKILNILPCDSGDSLDILNILGSKVIAKRGEFNTDDICIYIRNDALINMGQEYVKFLFDLINKNHIKEISGIAIPISYYPYEPAIGLDIYNFFI
jgi:hypothetical protein